MPGRGVEGVGDPVGDEGQDAPFAFVGGHGVEVFVCPAGVAFGELGVGLIDMEMQLFELDLWTFHVDDS